MLGLQSGSVDAHEIVHLFGDEIDASWKQTMITSSTSSQLANHGLIEGARHRARSLDKK